jgi:hypothetical protein
MRLFTLALAIAGICGVLAAARMMTVAQSPPAAYAAAVLGVAAVGVLGISLVIICLTAG